MRCARILLGGHLKPGKQKFRWNSHHPKKKNGPETKIGHLHNISVGESRKGPIAFTRALPEALEDFDLNTIELSNGEIVNAASLDQQKPCAKVVPDRMGLHELLIGKLRDKFGIKQFTPIQARILQNFYAHNDISSCAPTGSGKTLAICIALVARLMREVPPKQGSTIFLVPTEELGYQIERWLRAMWWYSEERDPLFLLHATSLQDVSRAYQLEPTDEQIIDVDNKRYILPNISGNIRYPPNNPYILLSTPEVFWQWLEYHAPMAENGINKDLFPQLDTIIIDEVESVFKVEGNLVDMDCPGRKILKQLYHCRIFDAPVQVLFNSATLAPTTVNHLHRFMKKNVFDPASVKMFPDTNQRGEYVHSKEDDETAWKTEMKRMRYYIPASVHVTFYLRMDPLSESREKMLRSTLATVRKLLDCEFQASKALVITETDKDETYMINALQSGNELSGASTNAIQLGEGVNLRKEGQTIVVSSSRRIRGIDIPGLEVSFVLGTPKNVIEFVHLAGRVGRLGSQGTCLFFIEPGDVRTMRDYCSLLDIDFEIQNKEDFFSDSM